MQISTSSSRGFSFVLRGLTRGLRLTFRYHLLLVPTKGTPNAPVKRESRGDGREPPSLMRLGRRSEEERGDATALGSHSGRRRRAERIGSCGGGGGGDRRAARRRARARSPAMGDGGRRRRAVRVSAKEWREKSRRQKSDDERERSDDDAEQIRSYKFSYNPIANMARVTTVTGGPESFRKCFGPG